MNSVPSNSRLSTAKPSREKQLKRDQRRNVQDTIATYLVRAGGVSVIFAVVLIFVYLLSVVFPIFHSAKLEPLQSFQAPGTGATLYLGTEEQFEIGTRITDSGSAVFFELGNGAVINEVALEIPSGASISSFAEINARSGWFGLGLDDGTVLVAAHQYKTRFEGETRYIDPVIVYPLGEDPLEVSEDGDTIAQLAVGNDEERITFVARAGDVLQIASYLKEESFSEDGFEVELDETTQIEWADDPHTILITPEQRLLYVLEQSGELAAFDVVDKTSPELIETVDVLDGDTHVSQAGFLLGGISLLVADSSGAVTQWFPARDESGEALLKSIRSFDAGQSFATDTDYVNAVAAEQRRKGFFTADSQGGVSIFHTTANRHIATVQVADAAIDQLVVTPRSNGMLLEDADGNIHVWSVENEHPEVSWQALWQSVWYESFEQPEYLWQSSASNNDFEPKFSLAPLTYGTLKAAFYAMLFAMPLAICGAIYTAYFMSSSMRKVVKPTIEIMEALPTVILGFLAGLWLAPFAEKNLLGVLLLLLVFPPVIIVCGYLWSLTPSTLQQRFSGGWYAALLLPVVVAVTWSVFAIAPALETVFFDGSTRDWLNSIGITFDQRNALVVGIAMGFAVIPTIFSISEDAIFGVPKSLTFGSLALGATPWQTLSRVVILTASPGIFSAVMIGLGRAVGETMIVLMATGNTPIMDFNIFEGMRTLSANIAVEMPESELGSSHYRILFLAALVLFIVTFLFNTVAELVRQRMREKYSNL